MPTIRRLPPDFSHSAAYPLYACDPVQDRGWVLHFEPDDYRQASFLDQRALERRQVGGWELGRPELAAAFAATPPTVPVHWLFHIGHCGSTLVSRLMDLLPGALGIREPLPLLQLAHTRGAEHAADWLALATRALARGFDDTTAVIVKPSSLVTTLTDALLAGSDGRAGLLWVALETWLATMLRDTDLCRSVQDTETLRLQDRPPLPHADGDGQRLARLWLGAQLRGRRLRQEGRGARLFDFDFAAVLADPTAAAARLADHFGLHAPADWPARVETSGLLSRYAKDPRQRFDADTRRRELANAATRHAREISRGVSWAEQAIARMDACDLQSRLRPDR